jgi:hypothetical protein
MTDEELTLAIAELQEVVRCRCDEAYRDRGLKDPHCECDSAEAVKVVARRIKALTAENERLGQQCEGLMQAGMNSGQALILAEAKLAKAVDLAIEECPFRHGTPRYNDWWHHRRATLAEIKGESHEALPDLR